MFAAAAFRWQRSVLTKGAVNTAVSLLSRSCSPCVHVQGATRGEISTAAVAAVAVFADPDYSSTVLSRFPLEGSTGTGNSATVLLS